MSRFITAKAGTENYQITDTKTHTSYKLTPAQFERFLSLGENDRGEQAEAYYLSHKVGNGQPVYTRVVTDSFWGSRKDDDYIGDQEYGEAADYISG